MWFSYTSTEAAGQNDNSAMALKDGSYLAEGADYEKGYKDKVETH